MCCEIHVRFTFWYPFDRATGQVRAARLVEDRCDAVDLNLGCPQKIAKKGNYGAYLLPNPKLCEEIVSKMNRCVLSRA